jgi:alanine-synthesizing transaminase
MYLFPKLDPKLYVIEDDQKFILDILMDKKVLLVQGSGFNWHDNNHLRLVFLPNEDELKIAIQRIAEYLDNFRKRKK